MKFQGKTHHEVSIKIEIKYINTWDVVFAAVDEMRMRMGTVITMIMILVIKRQ